MTLPQPKHAPANHPSQECCKSLPGKHLIRLTLPGFVAILSFFCIAHPTLALVKKPRLKSAKAMPARTVMPAGKATSTQGAAPTSAHGAYPSKSHLSISHTVPSHASRRTSTRRSLTPTRHGRTPAPLATYISPQLGTYAAESVEATLAESPASPFLYPHALEPFFRALSARQSHTQSGVDGDATIPATIRILQFGDSHTAADLFTGDLRAQLQSRFGNGGLGFQFPGHPFAGYRLAGSSRSQTSGWFTEGNRFTALGDGDLGLGGIGISTTRPGESIALTAACTTMQVHFLRQPGGGRLRFTDNGTYISDIDTGTASSKEAFPATTTRSAGSLTYACVPGEHTFELTTLDQAPVRLFGLVTEQPGITWECLGINGAVAPLMLRWNQSIFADYLRERDPTLIVLAYGTNEAAASAAHNEEYVSDFNRLLGNLHRIVPNAAILVLGPYDRAMRVGRGRRASWQTFHGTDRIIADQKESCRLLHCAFYDQRARMGGPGAMLHWVSAGMAQPDRTHLTGTGYRALAEALYRDLIAAYQAEPPPSQQAAEPAAARIAPPAYNPGNRPTRQPN